MVAPTMAAHHLRSGSASRYIIEDATTFTRAPVLFMTATSTPLILEQLRRITGFTFLPRNVFWPSGDGMMKSTIRIVVIYTNRNMEVFKAAVDPLYKPQVPAANLDIVGTEELPTSDLPGQWLMFANARLHLEKHVVTIRSHLDDNNYDGDVVVITGPMFREQKFYYTNLFLNPEMVEDDVFHSGPSDEGADVSNGVVLDSWPDGIKFDCRGCLATRSLGSAGWDGDRIHLVFSVDLPSDLLSLSQEMGRAGRRLSANASTDYYYVCYSLSDYAFLLQRIYKDDKSSDFARY
jgi:hypothetical protein